MTISPNLMSLEGKVAVVTGAAQGIGEAIALGLAAFGADLAVCDRDQSGLAATAAAAGDMGRRVEQAVFDVRDGAQVARWAAALGDAYGQIDVLVNNAGGGFHAWFLDVSSKGQGALVDENFTSVTHFVRAFVPLMPAGSSIVNVTSIEAFRAAPGFGVYAAMKAAVEQLTKTLALELADRGIRVNTIAPDAIPTAGDAGLASAVRGDAGSPDAPPDYGPKIPLGLGRPDDCAGPVVFLASDLARFVTGSTVHVDGGSGAASGWRRLPDGGGWEP
jgi:NAD(P)-dependent dehydrogenase (short-subunit alcohol dehydrogenase family)